MATTRVYKYGAVPIGGEDVPNTSRKTLPQAAIEELYKANRLWNRLVELHREHGDIYHAEREKADPEYKAIMKKINLANKKISEAYEAKRTARMKAGTKDATHPLIIEANEKKNALLKECKELYEARKPLAKKADEKIGKKRKKQLNKAFNDAVNVAIKGENSQLGSETANSIRQYFRTARDKAFKDPRSELQFHKFDGTGFWHYRTCLREKDVSTGKKKTSDGTTFPKLLLGNKKFEEDDRAFVLEPKKKTDKRAVYELRAKIAGGRKKDSKIYGRFDVIMHRPLPDNAQIQNIQLNRYRTGDKFSYAVNFTVRLPEPKPQTIPQQAIGVDLGFRKFFEKDGRIRIAAIATSDMQDEKDVSFIDLTTTNWQPDDEKSICEICGRKGHNAKRQGDKKHYLRRIEYVDCLKSKLDDSATELGKTIIPLIKSNPPLPEEERDKWPARINRMRKWPASITLSFEDAYKMQKWLIRVPQKADLLDKKIVNLVHEWWRKNSLHYREMHNLRRKALAARKEYYRIEAAKLVKRGLPIVFEKLNLLHMAKVKDTDTKLGNKARYQRFIGSPSEFRAAVKNAADREGICYIEVPPQYTSKTCNACGVINKGLAAEPEWICQSCGVVHDRDINAAINIAQKGLKALIKKYEKAK